MSYWRNINPGGAIADFRTVFRDAGRNRWKFALVAAVATGSVFSVMFGEEQRIPPRPPEVTYITAFEPGRSDAQIMAENAAHQKRKEQLAAEQAKREEEVRKIYKTLGRVSGMDVDRIERQAQAERAAEAKSKADEAAALRRRGEQTPVAGE